MCRWRDRSIRKLNDLSKVTHRSNWKWISGCLTPLFHTQCYMAPVFVLCLSSLYHMTSLGTKVMPFTSPVSFNPSLLSWGGGVEETNEPFRHHFRLLWLKTSNVMKFPFVGKQLGFSIIKVTFLMPVLPIFWEKNRHLLQAISRMW